MKKLIATLALLVFAGNIASAELLKNFKWDGKIVVNAMATNNAGDADSDMKDKTSDVNAAVYLNAGFDLTEDVEAVVSAVKSNRQYGTNSETVAAATADGFNFEQAYLNLKGVLGFDHKIGRQYYGDEGSLVVYYGPQGWPYKYADNGNPFSTSGIDGYTGWYKNDKLSIHAVAFKATDTDDKVATAATDFNDEDLDIVGVVGKYDLMKLLNVGAYIYEVKQSSIPAADTVLNVIGVKADGKVEELNLSYYAELSKNYGHDHENNQNFTGTAFLAGAKMDLDLVGKWSFSGELARGSGDKSSAKKNEGFKSINTDYRPGVIYSGVFGNTGVENLTTWNLGAKWQTPMFEKLTLSGKLYHFGYNEKVTSSVNTQTTDTIGNELDLGAKWQHNENVALKAYYAAFIPTSKYAKYALDSATANDDMVTTIGAAVSVKF